MSEERPPTTYTEMPLFTKTFDFLAWLLPWNTENAIVAHLEALPAQRRHWPSRHAVHTKMMWVAPLRLGRSMPELQKLYNAIE